MTRRLLILSLLIAASAPAADPAPDKVVAYRQTLMSSTGRHMKAIGMIVKGEIDRPQDLEGHAAALHAASRDLTTLFPPTTGPDKLKTDAKAEVWTRWTDFETAAKAFETETAALLEAARKKDIDAFKAQFGKVGDSCGGCHEPFKTKH